MKLGIDPTTADIHLGHTVVLGEAARIPGSAGHTVVLIVGDFTARVGDPSGRSASRPVPTPEEIEANATTYQEQAYKILDPERTEVRRNSEWLHMGPADLLRLMGKTTVARLLERDDFQKRMAANAPIAAHELLYPLLQGYDSVAIEADVELGGTDQKFNLLFGRDVQSAYGEPQQSILTMPILVGTDGVQKMSKSLGNYVGVTDAAGGDVRQADEHPRRGDGRVLPPAARRRGAPGGPAPTWPSASWAGGSSTASTARGAGRGRGGLRQGLRPALGARRDPRVDLGRLHRRRAAGDPPAAR